MTFCDREKDSEGGRDGEREKDSEREGEREGGRERRRKDKCWNQGQAHSQNLLLPDKVPELTRLSLLIRWILLYCQPDSQSPEDRRRKLYSTWDYRSCSTCGVCPVGTGGGASRGGLGLSVTAGGGRWSCC